MADSNHHIFINPQVAKNLKKSFNPKIERSHYNYLYPLLYPSSSIIKSPKISIHHGSVVQQYRQENTSFQLNENKFYDLNDDSAIGMSERQPLIDNEIGSSGNYDNIGNTFYPSMNYEGNSSDLGFNNRNFSIRPKYRPVDHFCKKKMLLDKKKQTTNLQTMMHIMKANIGTGILAMPNAFMNAGLYVGLISLPLLCMLCTHCMHILVRANEILSRRLETGMLEYQDVASKAITIGPRSFRGFSRLVALIINLFLLITQFGFCCVYSLFVAENISQFISELTPDQYHFSPTAYLGFLLPLLILLSFVKSLKHLSLASSIANLLQSVGLMIVMVNLIQDLPSPDTVTQVGSIAKFPLFLGTAIYAFEGIGLILPLQKEMQKPTSLRGYVGVLNTSMTLVACINIAIGFFGYQKFGDAVQGSITLNLPAEPLYQSCKVIFACAIFLSYSIQYYVPFTIIWPWFVKKFNLPENTKKTNTIEYFVRAFLVTFTVALAAAIPKLDLFISLVGAISSSGIALMFPPLIDICVLWDEEKGFWNWTWIFAKDLAIFLLGIAGFTTGTYASIKNILVHLN